MSMVASMDLNSGILVDVVLAVIILWKLISGIRNGAVRMIGGLVSLGCGIYGGGLLRSMFSEVVAKRWLEPGIRKVLDTAMNSLGLSDILENLDSLNSILDTSRLPGFLKLNVLEQVKERLSSGGESFMANAAEVVSQRLAGLILFLLGLVLITLLVRILFNGVVDPVISGLPVLNEANRFLGAVLGAVLGILIAGLVLALCYRLLPVFSQKAGSIFSDQSIQGSYIMKLYFRFFPRAFRG